MIRKLLILLIKFIPIMQMVGMLINNTLYYFDITEYCYLFDFAIGNSIINTILILTCSYVFKFCNWHRIIIYANFINLTIASIDATFIIPIEDIELLSVYYAISSIFIIIAVHNHVTKDTSSKKSSSRND